MKKAKKEKVKKPKKKGIFSNIIFSIKQINKVDKWYVPLLFVLEILRIPQVFLFPYILTVIVDGIEQGKDARDVILKAMLVTLICFIVRVLQMLVESNLDTYRKEKVMVSLQKKFYRDSLKIDYEKFESSKTQDAFEKAKRALYQNGGMLTIVRSAAEFIGKIFSLAIAATIIIYINLWLGVIIFGLAIIKFFLNKYARKKEQTEYRDKLPNINRRISYTDNISRNLSIGKDLRIYKMDKFINKERDRTYTNFFGILKPYLIRETTVGSFINVLEAIDLLAIYGFLIYAVLTKGMLIATFVYMLAAVREFAWSLDVMVLSSGDFMSCSYIIKDYRDFYEMNVFEKKETSDYLSNKVEIEFKNVFYSYENQEGYALNDVSFKIKAGEKIALVGLNGAGKTTLVKLLCGFYKPTKGEILINSVNINLFSRKTFQELIAPVFQDNVTIGMELGENISMSPCEESDEEKIKQTLKIMDLTSKVNSLPEKEKAILSREFTDTGVELSGGEVQKLAIARAIYKNAPLVILDEPTAALDAFAEYNLYNNLSGFIGNSTAIYISHRLAVTKICDRVLLLDDGVLIESGSHNELMKKDTEYKKLFNIQAKYYKEGGAL
jgi:ATP-binding cassette subfamily C protein